MLVKIHEVPPTNHRGVPEAWQIRHNRCEIYFRRTILFVSLHSENTHNYYEKNTAITDYCDAGLCVVRKGIGSSGALTRRECGAQLRETGLSECRRYGGAYLSGLLHPDGECRGYRQRAAVVGHGARHRPQCG